MRLTKIICTLGPSSHTPDMLLALAQNGMNIARVNFSHGTQEGHRETIQAVKEMNRTHGFCVALLLDTKGPEIRTGDVEEPIEVKNGQEVVFSSVPLPDEKRPVIIVNYKDFSKDVAKAENILLENGALPFDIVKIEKDGRVIGRANDDGSIGSRRHVNLPGADISLPATTDRDWSDIALGIEEKMDFVALSFIRTAEEIQEVRDFLRKNGSDMRIIAKIETRQAVANIDAIIDASDGIMVARGDLGAEIPFQKIPAIQDMIVEKCRRTGKPVIVATQMLESMIEHPMPTRAEVTDVAHAATTRADSTMLSGETAAGQHPIPAVRAMATTLEETESHLPPETRMESSLAFGERGALADAAVSMALSVHSPAIFVFTASGKTAHAVSMLRCGLPIIAFTESEKVQRMMQLYHAVIPLTIPFDTDPDLSIEFAFRAVKERKLFQSGQRVVVITDAKTLTGMVNTVHIRTIS